LYHIDSHIAFAKDVGYNNNLTRAYIVYMRYDLDNFNKNSFISARAMRNASQYRTYKSTN